MNSETLGLEATLQDFRQVRDDVPSAQWFGHLPRSSNSPVVL